MGLPECNVKNAYRNFFLTVPDRGFSKETLLQFVNSWRTDYDYCEIVREPYATPKAGWTHHYHVGLCFSNKVKYGRFQNACNKSKLFSGMDFRWPLVARGKSADAIFSKYFRDPSKYKSLDECPMLVRCRGPKPPRPVPPPDLREPRRQWGEHIIWNLIWQHS